MRRLQALIIPVLLIAVLPLPVCLGAFSVQFDAGTPQGWDFHGLDGDIARNNTVDWADLGAIAQYWLNSSCSGTNLWCSGADMDGSAGVDLADYALLAKNWSKQAGENILLQTIYGTAQDSSGNITANAYRALSINKGMAMAFSVPQDIALDKGIFKWRGVQASNNIRIRLYNVTGKGCLNYLHSISKADPGSGGALLIDSTITTPSTVPSRTEGSIKYTDMIINFGPLEVTAGDYLLVFDAMGASNTWGSLIRGTTTDYINMGMYPDGTPLPKRATVTSSSSSIGNTYYYELAATADTTYTPRTNLFALQISTTVINHAPTVDAGLSQTIVSPINFAVLDGSAADDGLPNPPGVITTAWSKQSGPGTVTFADANAVDTTATFSTQGTYVLRLTANDGQLSAYDEITITYTQNQAPAVNAGIDKTITYPVNSVSLDGTVTDDGLPNPPGAVTTTWTKQSGPGTVTFGNASLIDTTATFTAYGTYVLRLTANDGQLSSYDEATIVYQGQANQKPVANAGPDQTVDVNTVVTFDGSGSSDPDGNPLSYQWDFGDSTTGSGATATHTYSVPGIYTVTLTVSDATLSDSDTCKVFVRGPGNNSPVAGAGQDKTVYTGTTAVFDGSGSFDLDGNPLTGQWDFGDGATASGLKVTHTYTGAGTYTATLTVSDSVANSSDTAIVTVKQSNPVTPLVGGYEGYLPMPTGGGDNGTVVMVTTLNDSGAGSLRQAVLDLAATTQNPNPPPTIIKFGVGGTINLLSSIAATEKANFTIAGETAPSPGITLNAGGTPDMLLELKSTNVIIRHLRIRNAPSTGIQIWGRGQIIIDHCSISGCGGYGISLNAGNPSVTISRCLIYNNSDSTRSYGWDTCWHHNLFVNNQGTISIFRGGPRLDFRNNVIKNWTGTGVTCDSTHRGANFVNNYFDSGTSPFSMGYISNVNTSGNYCAAVNINALGDRPDPVPQPNVTTSPANSALVSDVSGNCGALPRDSSDTTAAGAASTVNLTANAGTDKSGSVGQSISFSGSGSSGTIIDYVWDFGDGYYATGVTATHSYSSPGAYTATLTVGNGTNTHSDTCIVTITSTTLPFANAGPDQKANANTSVNFDGSSSSDPQARPLTYSWDFGDGSTGSGAITTHSYSAAGTYVVTLTVNNGINTDSDTCLVSIEGNHKPICDAGIRQWGYVGEMFHFDGYRSYDPDGDILTYQWNFGDGSTATGPAPSHSFSSPATYNVILTVSDGQLTEYDYCLMHVYNVPTPNFYVSTTGSDSNPGTSDQPWRTIGKACAMLNAGQTVLVRAGTYAEGELRPTRGGSRDAPLTFKAEPGTVIDATGFANGIHLNGQSGIWWDGFEVKNATNHGFMYYGHSNSASVKNCIVHDCGNDGVHVQTDSDMMIKNLLIYNMGGSGTLTFQGIDNVLMDQLTCWHNQSGPSCGGGDDTVINCISAQNAYGIDKNRGSAYDNYAYNDVWGSTIADWAGDSGNLPSCSGGCLSANPLFVDPNNGDFHLQPSSPCKNAATDGTDLGYHY